MTRITVPIMHYYYILNIFIQSTSASMSAVLSQNQPFSDTFTRIQFDFVCAQAHTGYTEVQIVCF